MISSKHKVINSDSETFLRLVDLYTTVGAMVASRLTLPLLPSLPKSFFSLQFLRMVGRLVGRIRQSIIHSRLSKFSQVVYRKCMETGNESLTNDHSAVLGVKDLLVIQIKRDRALLVVTKKVLRQ